MSITADHRRIREELDARVKRALERGTANDLNGLVALLEGDLLAHARAEGEFVYPTVDRLVRDHGSATATMRIDHEAIEREVRDVAVDVERMRVARTRDDRMRAREQLREALIRLRTLLDVHLSKEERVYLPLLEAHLSPDELASLTARLGARETAGADIDVREIPQRQRHARVIEAVERLATGSSLTLLSDHDPRPLRYQLESRFPDVLAFEYLERGPQWRIRIRRTAH